jgi:hypothetical protein
MAMFSVIAPRILIEVYDVSEVLATSIIRAITLMMETTRLHGETTQKTAIFRLAAVRTSNLTRPLRIVPGMVIP